MKCDVLQVINQRYYPVCRPPDNTINSILEMHKLSLYSNLIHACRITNDASRIVNV